MRNLLLDHRAAIMCKQAPNSRRRGKVPKMYWAIRNIQNSSNALSVFLTLSKYRISCNMSNRDMVNVCLS